jgi:signal transduction histidine kinase/PAS domain-containing protein
MNDHLSTKAAEASPLSRDRRCLCGDRPAAQTTSDEALRQHDRLLGTALDNIAEAVILTDGTGMPSFVNRAARQLLGDAPPDGWAPRLGPYPAPLVPALRGEAVEAQEVFLRPPGAPGGVWVSLSARPLADQPGRVRGTLVVLRDVSERRRVEEQLRRLNRAHRALSRCNQALVRARDEPTLLREICRAVVEAAGYRLCWVGYAEQDAARTVRPVAQAGYEDGYLETVKVTGADTERGRGPTGTALRTGRPSVFRDVATDPLFAPWRAEALKRGYASVLGIPLATNGAATGVLTIYASEPDAFDDEEVQLLEALAKDLAYGITALRLRAEHAEAVAALRRGRDELEARVAERTAELARACKQARELAAGLERHAAAERRALEDLKQAQARLVQSERLAGLGQLVAGVAHEINNPLAFVLNNKAVLRRDVAALRELLRLYEEEAARLAADRPEAFAAARQYAERIDAAYTLDNLDGVLVRSADGLKRIQQIVKDLRDFARLDERDLQEADLNAGVASTLNIVRGRANKKAIRLEADLGPLPPVLCYPAKLNQVVLNLVANALDACPAGAAVTVRTRTAEGGVAIHVQDTGPGIDPAVLPRIFDPFFTTKPPGQGTGLGLSISHGIVADHGGRIEVASGPGRGAHFTVYLPLKPPPTAGPDK